ncbi:MAG: DNA glycosylase [Clostridia bacterium]|nr:DNA glycosylase [Clostridia bacterium]
MENQKLVIQKNQDFELKDIFDCGQCFRWNKENDESYTGVIKNGVLNVKCDDKNIYFRGTLNEDIQKIVQEYFDLNRDYTKIKNQLSKIDEYMETSITYGSGIRILNQDLWETIISFIISANNNIPRIKGIIERLSQKYGTKITFENNDYYLFPTPEQLETVTVAEFRGIGLGFRDIRLFETTHMILNNEIDLNELHKMDTKSAREQLLKLSGVGPKVADCILLFSTLKRFDIFPIDVWVRRVMNDLYIKNPDEKRVSQKLINQIAFDKFGELAGIAQQYLFYWKREN